MSDQILDLVPIKEAPPRLRREKTLYNLILAYMETTVGLASNSIELMRRALDSFELFCNQRKPTPEIWCEFQQHLCDSGYAAHYIKSNVTRVRSFFQWCEEMGHIDRTPCRGKFHLPPIMPTEKKTFSRDEYERMKKACIRFHRELKYQLVVTLYALGCNPKDACLLKWEEVSLEDECVRFVRHKMRSRGGMECSIPFMPNGDFHKLLLSRWEIPEYLKTKEGRLFVFPHLARKWVDNRNEVSMIMKSVFYKAGIKGKTLKHFRVTFCSELMNSGVNPVVACQMTGHKDPKTLMIYCKPEVEVLREAIATRNQFQTSKRIPKVKEANENV